MSVPTVRPGALRPRSRPEPADTDVYAVTAEYTEDFFDAHHGGARRSARAIVPLVMRLVRPRSVVDVGCGTGTWLSVFAEHGVSVLVGIDGARLSPERLDIPPHQLLNLDLRKPIRLQRQFDLVVSLEVAEHLPGDCADSFVESLTRLGPVIMFSAAVPGQGGTQHVNEQWPDYWAGRFERRGYVPADPIRQAVWSHAAVDVWYAQNVLLFVRQRHLARHPALRRAVRETRGTQLAVVHPRLFEAAATKCVTALNDYEAAEAYAEKQRAETDAHRGKAEFYIAEASRYRDEADSHRASAAHAMTEAARARDEADAHRASATHAIAEADRYRSEADALRAKLEVYVADLEQARAATEAQRRKLDLYVAAATRFREEAASQKIAAEYYLAEAARHGNEAAAQREEAGRCSGEAARSREEAATARAVAEQLHVECVRQRAEIDRVRAELERYRAEAESHRAKAEFYIAESEVYRHKADARNLSFRRVLRALPTALRGALTRRTRRLLARA